MHGDEVARRARELYADVPIVLASGRRSDDLTSSFGSDSLVQFLEKPFDVGDLMRVLHSAGIRTNT
jgi:FixJ family two-component response regulator